MAGKTNDSLDKLHNEVPAAQPSGRDLFASHRPRWLTSLNPVVDISTLFILLAYPCSGGPFSSLFKLSLVLPAISDVVLLP